LERQRLDFQMKQWEAEKYDREEQRKIEMARIENKRARIEAEKAEREVERTQREMQRQFDIERLAAEKAEREEASSKVAAFPETQLELQQRQLKLLV